MILCNIFHALVEKTIPYEEALFLWLNGQHCSFFDTFMIIYTDKLIWIPFMIVSLGVFTIKTNRTEALLVILAIILVCCLCDQLASSVIKPLCERFRPTHFPGIENWVHTVNGYRGGKYGFISSHAANGFGFATFLSLLFRHRLLTVVAFFAVSITAYSRIYLGVHFISDVICGIIIGILIGWGIYILYTKARTRFLQISTSESKTCAFKKSRADILSYTTLASILIILIISTILNF